MLRSRVVILLAILALLIFAPPAILLFGDFDRPSPRDRENAAIFDKPVPPRSATKAPYVPPGTTPGELKRFGRGTLIRALALSPDGRTVAAVSTDTSLRTWALDGSTSSSFGIGSYSNYNAIAYSPDGNRVLAGPVGVPILWDPNVGQIQYLQSSFAEGIQCLAIAPNGASAVSGSDQGTVRVWNLDTLNEVGVVGRIVDGARTIAVAYSPDGRHVRVASDVGDVQVYELKSGQNLMSRRYGLPWRVGAFSTDGNLLLTGSNDGHAGIYDLEDQGNQRLRFKAHIGPVTAVAFSPDASRIATASGTEVSLWETATGRKLATLRAPNQQHVHGALAVLPTNRHVLFGGDGISLLLMPSPAATQPAR